MRCRKNGAKRAVFDYQGINIDTSKAMVWSKDAADGYTPQVDLHTNLNPNLGHAAVVNFDKPCNEGDELKIRLAYETTKEALAINWLKPSQTAGKKLPYLFTQCESIACRSVAPMQDTPANKITYSADVKVKKEFVVKMSANETRVVEDGDYKVYSYENTIKMPSYLIALAVGDLEYRSLGDRVGVITEPSQMDRVADELDSLQTLLDKTEEYLTPYIWGNYSILILPPSFPFGGMENPLLTFASPTIIAGDKSQVYVATHEIAHSWTGNDVTCRDWESFWLNEGFTVFEERKVSEQIHGTEFALVEALLGNSSMYTDMVNYGLDHPFSSLHPTLKGSSPDEAFSTIPYEKGFQLLTYLESLIGKDNFQAFLRAYILENAQKSLVTDDFRAAWERYVENTYVTAADVNRILGAVDWDAWIYQPGLPPVHLDFTTTASNQSSELADQYIALKGDSSPENYADFIDHYYSNLKVIFLERLSIRKDDVTLAILQKIDADYNLTATVDPEVKQRWFPLGIYLGYEPVTAAAFEFVSSQGRLKYLSPIYLALLRTNQRDLAVEWFNKNKDFYHPLAVSSLKKLLNIKAEEIELIQ